MAFIVSDRVRESNIVSGTGPVTCGGAVPGFNTFASAGASYTTWYAIADNTAGAWEVGLGTYGGGALTRTTVYSSSNNGVAVNFTGNVCDCYMDIPATWVSSLSGGTTGSGAVVLANTPTLIAPALGTPSSVNLANATGYPVATSATFGIVQPDNVTVTISGGVLSSVGGSGALIVGTTGITGGSSGNILYDNAGKVGELTTTGSGAVVLATSPTLVTPALGTPTSGNLANTTGYPAATSSTPGIIQPDNLTVLMSGSILSSPLYALFGTGADGNVTIGSGTTTMTRDMNCNNLTISGTGKLSTAGFRVCVAGTLDISGAGAQAIFCNSGAFLGSGPTSGVFAGGVAGGTGVGAAGTQFGGALPQAAGGNGGASGVGGSGGSGAGGAAAAQKSLTVQYLTPMPLITFPSVSNSGNGTVNLWAGVGGASGGSGAGDGTNAGGGSQTAGAGGGSLLIYAATIARGSNSTAAVLQAKGGAGLNGNTSAAGNTGGGGGSGGGGGGFVYIVAGQLTGSTITNAIDVSGGTGGTGGGGKGTGAGGAGGASGNGGAASIINLSAATFTQPVTWNTAGNAGSAASGTTGGAGGSVVTVQGNL